MTIAGPVWLRLESLSLERDLRRARVRALDAVDAERQRIQRDLHDSAQQRLVSIRIHMGLLAQAAATEDDARRSRHSDRSSTRRSPRSATSPATARRSCSSGRRRRVA